MIKLLDVSLVNTEEVRRSNAALDVESVGGAGSGGVSRLLSAGVRRFNFSHNLPTSLPSSFESHVDHSRRRVASHQQHHHHHQQQQQRKQEQRIKVYNLLCY